MNASQINNPVILRKNLNNYSKKEQNNKFGETILRPTSTKTNKNIAHSTTSIKMEDPDYKPKIVTTELAKKITSARLEQKLTQEQLAQKCNIALNIVKTIEKPNSTTVYNHQQMQKIAKILKISLKIK
jgi:ribosome-binding protein aMBF1 (putative translation factor)